MTRRPGPGPVADGDAPSPGIITEMSDRMNAEVARLASRLEERGWRLATAESCTGGLLAAALTARPGSSTWFECGYVTYSNTAKHRMLGVPEALIAAHGAVSQPVVEAMVAGALARSGADLAVAISGIAGPGGGTPDKPVGTVWLAWGTQEDGIDARRERFPGDREAVREQAVLRALEGLIGRAKSRGQRAKGEDT